MLNVSVQPAPFKAQALPDFSGGPTVPAKKELLPTKPQPFHLQSVARANKHASDWKEKVSVCVHCMNSVRCVHLFRLFTC